MKKNVLILCLLGLLAGVFFMAGPAWSEQIVLRYAGQLPVTHHITQADQRFAKMVEERTGGKVKIEVYPAGQLYKGASIAKAVMSGAIEMGIVFNGAWTGPVPLMDLFEMHFIFKDYNQIEKAWNGKVGDLMRAEMEKNNAKALGFGAYGGTGIINRKRPLKMPQDFKGLKIRTPSPMHADTVKALGAAPVMMSSSEVYMALQRGTIDGSVSGPTSLVKRKWFETAEYVTITNSAYSLWPIAINLEVWNKLPKDIQKVLLEAAIDTTKYTISLADQEDQKAIDMLSEKVKVHTLTAEESEAWKEAVQNVREIFVKRAGKDGVTVIKWVEEM